MVTAIMTLSLGYLPTVTPLQLADGVIPKGSRVTVFREIFTVFLVLGTLVGVVVIGYMLYNAYKYRDREGRETEGETPELGELPSGGGGGRKLFLSFGLSTIIVISLIIWTYGTLLYVEENPPGQGEDGLEVTVEGYRFGWDFVYPNGNTTSTLYVPEDEPVHLTVTSDDVFHTFGVPELRVKTDAIPGQETETWFIGNETGTYEVRCFELCGAGHSFMTAEVEVMEPGEYEDWYANTTAPNATETTTAANESASLAAPQSPNSLGSPQGVSA